MKTYAKTEYYELSYDGDIIYDTIIGSWKDISIVTNYESDLLKVIKLVGQPFKMICDITQMKTISDEIKVLYQKINDMLIHKGCVKMALMVESAITKLSVDSTLKESKEDKIIKYFSKSDLNQAKKWINE